MRPDYDWFKKFKQDVESGNMDREFLNLSDLQSEIQSIKQQCENKGIPPSEYEKLIKTYQQRNNAMFKGYAGIGR